MANSETTPVVVGVGAYRERPANLDGSKEPVALMSKRYVPQRTTPAVKPVRKSANQCGAGK